MIGPPKVAAEIVTVNRRNWDAIAIVEPIVRVSDGVANEIISAAMELVRARARDHIDH